MERASRLHRQGDLRRTGSAPALGALQRDTRFSTQPDAMPVAVQRVFNTMLRHLSHHTRVLDHHTIDLNDLDGEIGEHSARIRELEGAVLDFIAAVADQATLTEQLCMDVEAGRCRCATRPC